MDLDLTLTSHGFTLICAFALIALALNFSIHVFFNKEDLLELGVATLMAEVFVLSMWLLLCGIHNL